MSIRLIEQKQTARSEGDTGGCIWEAKIDIRKEGSDRESRVEADPTGLHRSIETGDDISALRHRAKREERVLGGGKQNAAAFEGPPGFESIELR